MTILGIDRSHFNAEPNFAQFKAGGGAFVFCKATEGTSWSDATFAACRAGTEAAGLVFGSYHFARWGDPAAEARWYLSVATPRAGELVALDAEAAIPAGVDVVAWSLAFCQAVHAACGAWPFVYMNQAWLTGHNWAPLAANDGLWLARYDGQPTGGPTGPFPVLAMKQYSDRGIVGGFGPVDVDAFQGDLATLLKYAVPGGDMALTAADVALLFDTPVNKVDANGNATGQQVSLRTFLAWDDPKIASVALQVWDRRVSRQDDSTGGQLEQIPAIQELADAKTNAYAVNAAVQALAAKVDALAQAQAPTIDEAKLAAALLANPDAVNALGQAIAANLQLTSRAQQPPAAS